MMFLYLSGDVLLRAAKGVCVCVCVRACIRTCECVCMLICLTAKIALEIY